MSDQSANHISLQGQSNFRDLGGFKTADRRTVRSGLIYRSGELNNLTDDDIARLEELGIKTVVDFRSEAEVAWRGEDRLPEGVQYIPLRIEPGNLGPEFFQAVESGAGALVPENLLEKTNRAVIRDATGQMSGLFRTLLDPSNLPLVLHCTHGKDRTGVASAILLMALGVPAKTAEADYLKSNDFRQKENEKELADLRQIIAASQGIDPSEAAMSEFRALFSLEPSLFAAMLDEVRQQYGSLQNYLKDGLGIDASQLEALRQQFTQ